MVDRKNEQAARGAHDSGQKELRKPEWHWEGCNESGARGLRTPLRADRHGPWNFVLEHVVEKGERTRNRLPTAANHASVQPLQASRPSSMVTCRLVIPRLDASRFGVCGTALG